MRRARGASEEDEDDGEEGDDDLLSSEVGEEEDDELGEDDDDDELGPSEDDDLGEDDGELGEEDDEGEEGEEGEEGDEEDEDEEEDDDAFARRARRDDDASVARFRPRGDEDRDEDLVAAYQARATARALGTRDDGSTRAAISPAAGAIGSADPRAPEGDSILKSSSIS